MKVSVLLSDGIDSPVASYLMLKKNYELVFINFKLHPEDSSAEKKIKKIINILKKYSKHKIKLYIIPFYDFQSELKLKCESRFNCLLCKRIMYKTSERISEKESAQALVTGENLAQVASQTLENLKVLNEAVNIPIIRPLIGFDKNETIKIAKRIGTYDPSILFAPPCPLVPKKPATKARIEDVKGQEKKLGINKLINEIISKSKIKLYS